MKTLISTLAALGLALGVATPSFADHHGGKWERPYGMAGCGLGSLAMGKKGGQIFAATTNSTSYNKYFGITSGTLNCLDGPTEEVAQKMDRFIYTNKVALAGDMARGNGETLGALAAILGCSNTQNFDRAMQDNFTSVFPHEKVNYMEVTDSVINVIIQDQDLHQSCSKLDQVS